MRVQHKAPPGGHTVTMSGKVGRRGRTLKHTTIEHIGKGGVVTHRFGHAGTRDEMYGPSAHETRHVFMDRKGLMSHLTSTMGSESAPADDAERDAGTDERKLDEQ